MNIKNGNLHNAKTAIVAAILFLACSSNQAIATDPNSNKPGEPNMNKAQEFVANYYTQLLKQCNEKKPVGTNFQNFIDQGKINDTQVSKMVDSFPVKNQQINQSAQLMKGLVYNPERPGPFFDSLIALQNISLNAQSGIISLGEKTLGPKNNYVISMKANYDRSVKYLDALKQQKILLEQSMPLPHR